MFIKKIIKKLFKKNLQKDKKNDSEIFLLQQKKIIKNNIFIERNLIQKNLSKTIPYAIHHQKNKIKIFETTKLLHEKFIRKIKKKCL